MSSLSIGELSKFISNLPDDYTVEFHDNNNVRHVVSDRLEVDLSDGKLVLKS